MYNDENKQQVTVNPKFYERGWVITLSLLIFFPLGLVLVWRHNKIKTYAKTLITIIIVICLSISVSTISNYNVTNSKISKVPKAGSVQVKNKIDTADNIYLTDTLDLMEKSMKCTDSMDKLYSTNGLETIKGILKIQGKNPKEIITDEFKLTIINNLKTVKEISKQANSKIPTEKYKEMNVHLLLYFEYKIKSIENFELGIQSIENKETDVSLGYINKATAFTKKATEEIDKANVLYLKLQGLK